jgi:branched-chain amino acid transport system substrate-binding protein
MNWQRSVFLSVTILLCVAGQVMAAEPLRVGMSGAFSGPIRALGIEIYRGAAAYFEHVNRGGGIRGRPIHFIAYDDAYDPATTLENTVRLVEEDQVDLLFSYVGTPTVTRILPLLKVYEDRNLLLFFPATGAEPQRRPPYDQFVLNMRASYAQEVEALVREFTGVGMTRFAILYQVDAYGRSGWEGLQDALQRRSLAIVEEATYQRGFLFEQSMREQVEILRRAEPDVIISIATYAAAAAFIRDARDAGWDVPVANVSFVNSESMLALLLDQGQLTGRDYTQNLINSQVVPSYEDFSLWGVMEYRWIMDHCQCVMPMQLTPEEHEPQPYSFASFEGLLNAKVLTQMLRTMSLESITTMREDAFSDVLPVINLGIGEPVTFGPEKRQGLDTVYFSTVRDGCFVPLTDWTRWKQP